MYQISKTTSTKIILIIVTVYVFLCGFIIIHFQFNLLNSILLVLSGGGVVLLLDPLLKPLVKLQHKKTEKKQMEVNKHIAIAKKQRKKCFGFPKNNPKHTVWASNWLKAQQIFSLKIQPQIKNHPNKRFYYITETCNNLKTK